MALTDSDKRALDKDMSDFITQCVQSQSQTHARIDHDVIIMFYKEDGSFNKEAVLEFESIVNSMYPRNNDHDGYRVLVQQLVSSCIQDSCIRLNKGIADDVRVKNNIEVETGE